VLGTSIPVSISDFTIRVYLLFLHLFLSSFLCLFNYDGSLIYKAVDYGGDVAGKPIFHVQVAEGNPQIEVKYTEAYP
jgi:hypothetical protein